MHRQPTSAGPIRPMPAGGGAAMGLLALAACSLLLSGCDNVARIFGNWQGGGGGGGVGAQPALFPLDHEWIVAGAPDVLAVVPSGSGHAPSAPLCVFFTESIAPGTLEGAFEIRDTLGLGQAIPFLGPVLVGDGRLALLLPLAPIPSNYEYELRLSEDAAITDLQGVELETSAGSRLSFFAIDANPPDAPQVVASFPRDATVNQSAFGEIAVVFDRVMNPATFTTDSWAVTAGGAPPAFHPLPAALSYEGVGGLPVVDPRVFLWRSVDDGGIAQNLGSGLTVELELSGGAVPILDAKGEALEATTLDFDTADIITPLDAAIVSIPDDAISIDNISGPTTLAVEVTVEDAQAGDQLRIHVFGTSTGSDPQTIALVRSAEVTAITTLIALGEAEIDLAKDQATLAARLADGEVGLAFGLSRGAVNTPVRVLDVDPELPGIDHPLLDTERPTILGFGPEGLDQAVFRSSIRQLAVVGVASERVRSAEVTAVIGDNGTTPPVVGGDEDGLFVAAPIANLEILDPAAWPAGLDFDVTVYDEALNASEPLTGTFFQHGASGPGIPLTGAPGETVTVEVVDAGTLEAVQGALVFSHEDAGAGSFPWVDDDVTGASGTVVLDASGSGNETLITVDAAGYELFTFHGVPTSRLSVALGPALPTGGVAGGIASSPNEDVTLFERFAADSRFLPQGDLLVPIPTAIYNPITGLYDCPYGPAAALADRMGAAAFVLLDTPPDEFNYSHLTFLRAFELQLPLAPIPPAGLGQARITADPLLDEPGIDPELRPIDGPALTFDDAALPVVEGAPRVAVQAVVRGLPGSAVVGAGLAFGPTGTIWSLRCAYGGVADGIQDVPTDELGRLVVDGVIEADLLLYCETRDGFGSRSGRRPRLSLVPGALAAPPITAVHAPALGSTTAGAEYDVEFDDVIPDSLGMEGLYRAVLLDSAGRTWSLYRIDAPGAPGSTISVHLPDIAALGGTPLSSGPVAAAVAAYAWPGMDPEALLFTDVDREYDLISERVGHLYNQP